MHDRLIEIIYVKKVLTEIAPYDTTIIADVIDKYLITLMTLMTLAKGLEVRVVDDSSVGLAQFKSTLDLIYLILFNFLI